MAFISLFGLLLLVGIAWSLSFHRSEVKLRPVFWGLGLQLLFALIILRQDEWSFVGMAILAGLIVTYILQKPTSPWHGKTSQVAALVAVLAVISAAATALIPGALNFFVLAAFALVIASRWLPSAAFGTLASSSFFAFGVGALFASGRSGEILFSGFSTKVAQFLGLADYGSRFLFANLMENQHFFPGPDAGWPGFGFLFAFKVLPTIIFFGGFMSVLYYLGIMQKVIETLAQFMRWTIGTSGAETLSCSANMFVGQTEAPLLIKPFLDKMTRSELTTIMVGGFATIAGGVLAGYIAMGVPAGHLVAASVMSAPAALVIGKLIYPELEHSETAGDVELPKISVGDNVLEAASNGITDGLKLAVNVGAMLLGFISLIAVADVLLNWADGWIDGRWLGGAYYDYGLTGLSPAVGEYAGYFPGSLQTFFGTVLRPVAWAMGVPWADADKVGNLLGIKLSLNEFVAYGTLGSYIQNEALSERGTVIATYALCGFANFSSIGIQIGGISAIAPERKSELARVGLRAMFGGAIASALTATIAGILVG